MTKAKLVDLLKSVKTRIGDDPEVAHSCADELLLKYINSPEVEDAYNDIPKWYA